MLAQYTIRCQLERVTPNYGGDVRVQTSTVRTDRVEKAMDKIAALEEQINGRIDELVGVKGEILAVIGKVSDGALRTVLIERYVNFKQWMAIGKAMCYDADHVRKVLHQRAVEEVGRILGETDACGSDG